MKDLSNLFKQIADSDIEHQAKVLWKRNWGEYFCKENKGWILTNRDASFHNFIKRYYTEPHRHYHDLHHIIASLKTFEEHFVDEATCPEEIRMAIWFHDLVYNTKAKDNERRSADIARAVLGSPTNELSINRICGMIKRTAHMPGKRYERIVPPSYDARILLDVDLSILSSDEKVFAEYESNIQKEYDWVNQEVFATKRIEFLNSLLDAKHIFWTEYAKKEWEDIARDNIENSIRIYQENSFLNNE